MRNPSPLHYYDISALMNAINLRNERPHWRSDGGGGGGGSSIPPNINWRTRPSFPGGATDMGGQPPPTSGGGSWPTNPYPISGQPAPSGIPGLPPPLSPPPGQPSGGPSIPSTYRGLLGARMTGGDIVGGVSGMGNTYESGYRTISQRGTQSTADMNRWANMMQDDDSFLKFLFENDMSNYAEQFSSLQDPEKRKAFKLAIKKMMSGAL